MSEKVTLISHTSDPIYAIYQLWYASRSDTRLLTPLDVLRLEVMHEYFTQGKEPSYVGNRSMRQLLWDGKLDNVDIETYEFLCEVYKKFGSPRNLFKEILWSNVPVGENVFFTFMLENVSVAFREQLVRHRDTVYVPDGLLYEKKGFDTFWSQTSRARENMGEFHDRGWVYIPDSIKSNPIALKKYMQFMEDTQKVYADLIDSGIHQDDARMVIPVGYSHRISWGISLTSLVNVFSTRSCFTGDTKISLLDGRELSFEEIHREFGYDKEFWVYSCDENGNIVPGRAKSLGVTNRVNRLVEVELDNGEKVRCTHDHLWMLRDGTYKNACDLTDGDSLMPLYRRDGDGYWSGYEEVYNPSTCKFELTHHRTINYNPPDDLRLKAHCQRCGLLRHHKDFDKRNNSPDNLEWMTYRDHVALHRDSGVVGLWKNDVEYRKRATKINSENGKKYGYKNLLIWNSSDKARYLHADVCARQWKDPEYRDIHIPRLREKAKRQFENKSGIWVRHENQRIKRMYKRLIRSLTLIVLRSRIDQLRLESLLYRYDRQQVANILGIHWREVELLCWYYGIDQVRFRNIRNGRKGKGRSNPSARVTLARIRAKLWSDPEFRKKMSNSVSKRWKGVSKSESHRKALSESRKVVVQGRKRDLSGRFVNHKVVSVREIYVTEDVYDISVDKYHNFALSSGVFVHNCWIAQSNIWHPVLSGIVKELSMKVDPIFKFIADPPCIRKGKWGGCPVQSDNRHRMDGNDPAPVCPLFVLDMFSVKDGELYKGEEGYTLPVQHTWDNMESHKIYKPMYERFTKFWRPEFKEAIDSKSLSPLR